MNQQYRPNSYRYKEGKADPTPEKKVEKVVTGNVTVKKKSEIRKFADIFMAEDFSTVKQYLWEDVLLPLLRDGIMSIIENGSSMLIYGEPGRKGKVSYGNKKPYSSYYSNDRREPISVKPRIAHDYEEWSYKTSGDAAAVLSELEMLIAEYQFASIQDLYIASGVQCNNYTYSKYGWSDLRDAEVVSTRDGWRIKLPKAEPLN